ncbi:MAG: hypothetical protein ABEI31_06835 [Halodesulfurarchaeum sp.]
MGETSTCPLHGHDLEQVAENKYRCPAGHAVHESAVGREDLFMELRDGDDPALAAFAEALLSYEGGRKNKRG